MWITDRENNFLGGVKPTGYKDIYPDGRQTIKNIFSLFVLPRRLLAVREIDFSLSVVFFLMTGDHQKDPFPCRC
jgi:hypothetical protein